MRVSVDSDGTVRIDGASGKRVMSAALLAAEPTTARAESAAAKWLADNGFAGWGVKVTSLSPLRVMVTSHASVPNWWLGGVL